MFAQNSQNYIYYVFCIQRTKCGYWGLNADPGDRVFESTLGEGDRVSLGQTTLEEGTGEFGEENPGGQGAPKGPSCPPNSPCHPHQGLTQTPCPQYQHSVPSISIQIPVCRKHSICSAHNFFNSVFGSFRKKMSNIFFK